MHSFRICEIFAKTDQVLDHKTNSHKYNKLCRVSSPIIQLGQNQKQKDY